MFGKEKYSNIGLDVGKLAPEFILKGRIDLSLSKILKHGPLVLIVSENNLKQVDNSSIVVRDKTLIEQINNHGGSYLKIFNNKKNLLKVWHNNYNESVIIYIIDRKRLICYKKEISNYKIDNEIKDILVILNFIT